MPPSDALKPWWEKATRPRKHSRDAIEEGKVREVIAELPTGSQASKAYDAGAHTALLMHLSPANRPDLHERLRRAMAEGNARQQQRTKSLRSRFSSRLKRRA
jgi:hypothetical protein